VLTDYNQSYGSHFGSQHVSTDISCHTLLCHIAHPGHSYFTTSSNAMSLLSHTPNSHGYSSSGSAGSTTTPAAAPSSTSSSSGGGPGVSRTGFGGKVSVPVLSVLQEPLIAEAAEVSLRAHHIGEQ
jgi:hypothetical protein